MSGVVIDNQHVTVGAKVGVVWSGWLYGGLTDFPIATVVLWVTLIYTCLQIFKLVREELRARKAKREASAMFAESLRMPEIDP